MAKKRKIPELRSEELVASIRREMNLPRLAESVRSSRKGGNVLAAESAEQPKESRPADRLFGYRP